MKKLLTIVLMLCLLLTSAVAELSAPALEDRLTEVGTEDFVGCWEMFMCTSGKPVDMRSYYYVNIYDDGYAVADYGNSSEEVRYETTVQEPENGVLYIADENGENGAYYFLFDESLMGCAKTMDNPDTIIYLECVQEEPWSESSWREEASAALLEELGEITPVTNVQDCAGIWQCWATTTAEMGQIILDPSYIAMTLEVAEQKATLNIRIAGEEEVREVTLEASEQGVSFYSEDDDENYWFFLRGEDDMVLLDDPEMPVSALYFYTPERWAEEEANGSFNNGLNLTETVEITSLEQVAGVWSATHAKLLGYVEEAGENYLTLDIRADGSAFQIDEYDDAMELTAEVQDGYVILRDTDGYSWYLRLYVEGVLEQALTDDDFSGSICYQRVTEE